jgi:4'-phosphopantetheinyl transferase
VDRNLIRVVRVDLERAGCADVLSGDERARAARFLRDDSRRRFVAARAALRRLLAEALRCAPDALAFGYEPGGRPFVAEPAPGDLVFNVSHSGELALLAIGRGRRLGVDVERLGRRVSGEAIARRFFAPREAEALLALPEAEQPAAFLRIWTRKEAYIKALGEGLRLPLDSFEVSLGDPPRLLRSERAPADLGELRFAHLEPLVGYVGALAWDGGPARVETSDFVL